MERHRIFTLVTGDQRPEGTRLIDEAGHVDGINDRQGDGRAISPLWAKDPSRTGAPGPEARPRVQRVPRLHSYGRYYRTATEFEEVQVMERTDEAVYVRPVGGEEVVEIPRTEHDLFTLVFGDEDWEVLLA